jgi:uracil-DNA glycosylase
MAKKSSNVEGIDVRKIKQDKQKSYEKLKYLTKWLFNPEKYNIELLTENLNEFNSSLRYRLYGNILTIPKIIWYVNKYLNHIDTFHITNAEDLLRTFSDIIKIYGLKNSSSLHFSRFQTFKRDSFSDIIQKYCEETNSSLNKQDVINLYRLFEIGIIKSNEIEEMEDIIEGKEKILKSNSINTPIEEIKLNQTKSAEIINFSNNLLNFKTKRNPCIQCPLYYRQTSVIDTNISSFTDTPVDIAIVANETALEQDIQTQSPLSGEDGIYFRSLFYPLVKKYNLKYIITNASLCFPANKKESEPTATKKAMANCRGMIDEIHSSFKPKLIVLFGSSIIRNYGIKDKITDINGEIIDKKYFCMTSPLEALRSKTYMDRFLKAMFLLEHNMSKSFQIKNLEKTEQTNDNNTDTDTVQNLSITSSRIEKGDTLFNIETLNDQLVYVFIDSNNKKKYIIEQIQYPIFIKNGKYQECNYIEEDINYKVILSHKQKQTLSHRLNQNIKYTIEC